MYYILYTTPNKNMSMSMSMTLWSRHVNREDLGTRVSCFGCENKNGGHLTRFKSKN